MDTTIDDEAEQLVRALADELARPSPGECLLCFVDRLLSQFGCDGTLRFALEFRDRSAPRATALARRLGEKGGYCDCEIFMNAYEPVGHLWSAETWVEEDDGGEYCIESEPPAQMPPCTTVHPGSVQPCGWWVRQRRFG